MDDLGKRNRKAEISTVENTILQAITRAIGYETYTRKRSTRRVETPIPTITIQLGREKIQVITYPRGESYFARARKRNLLSPTPDD